MRFLVTALPQLFDTKSPSRGGPGHPGELTTTIPPLQRRLPSDRTLRKSRELRSVSYSGSESLSALETTILDRRPTGAGAHAVTESVTTLSAANFGLICPLHDESKGVEGGTGTDYGGTKSCAIRGQPPNRYLETQPAKKRGNPRKFTETLLVAR